MKNEQRQPPSYPLRLEPEIRAKLEAIAKANGRSLNAEISLRLEASLKSVETTHVNLDEIEEKFIKIATETFEREFSKFQGSEKFMNLLNKNHANK